VSTFAVKIIFRYSLHFPSYFRLLPIIAFTLYTRY